MFHLQAYKYELMPDGEQERNMRRFAGTCRFVYNKALAMQKENHEAGNKFIGYAPMAANLPIGKREMGQVWLKDAPSQALQQALKDLEKAYKNFFAKRADFPRFKRKGSGDSVRYPDPKQIKLDQASSRILLPKLGWLRYRNSRDVLGELRNVTLSQSGGKWFASIQTQREVGQPLPTATTAIGIDVGIARFATMSDGGFIAPLNSFKKHQQWLARYQRRMSRKARRPQSNSATTGRRRKPASKRFIPASPMPAKTSCTKSQRRSGSPPAQTTRSCALRICRYGTWRGVPRCPNCFAVRPGLPKVRLNSRAKRSARKAL
jgi:putative transposase